MLSAAPTINPFGLPHSAISREEGVKGPLRSEPQLTRSPSLFPAPRPAPTADGIGRVGFPDVPLDPAPQSPQEAKRGGRPVDPPIPPPEGSGRRTPDPQTRRLGPSPPPTPSFPIKLVNSPPIPPPQWPRGACGPGGPSPPSPASSRAASPSGAPDSPSTSSARRPADDVPPPEPQDQDLGGGV